MVHSLVYPAIVALLSAITVFILSKAFGLRSSLPGVIFIVVFTFTWWYFSVR
jgi:hypothetical protein